jgi:predicted RNA-binding Zn-ribbon protein involved in translation (DUF1610 family)
MTEWGNCRYGLHRPVDPAAGCVQCGKVLADDNHSSWSDCCYACVLAEDNALTDDEVREMWGYEPTPSGWKPLVKAEAAAPENGSESPAPRPDPVEQDGGKLNPEARSSGRTAAYIALPASHARTYAIAVAQGTWYPSPRDQRCSVISKTRAETIRNGIGMGLRAWQYFVTVVLDANLAHLCHSDKLLTLFLRPFENPCPKCGSELVLRQKRSGASPNRHESVVANKVGSSRGTAFLNQRVAESSREPTHEGPPHA